MWSYLGTYRIAQNCSGGKLHWIECECHLSIFYPTKFISIFCKTLDFRIKIWYMCEWRLEVQRFQYLNISIFPRSKIWSFRLIIFIFVMTWSCEGHFLLKTCTLASIKWPFKLLIVSYSASLNTNRFSELMKDNSSSDSPKFFSCQ